MVVVKRITLAVMLLITGTLLAQAKLPAGFDTQEFGETQYAVLRDAEADRQQVKPGEQFTLALRLTPYEGFHTYGFEAPEHGLYEPTRLVVAEAPDVTWEIEPPPPVAIEDEMFGTMYEYVEQHVVLIHGTLAPDAKPGPRTFTAELEYSACTGSFCLAPSVVEVSWQLEVVAPDFPGEIAVAPVVELTKPKSIDLDRFGPPPGYVEAGTAEADVPEAEAAVEVPDTSNGGTDWANLAVTGASSYPLSLVLLWALLGGLILNIMPCVLPVVSIKVISLVRQAEEAPQRVVLHGLMFMAGIIATFLAGSIIIALLQLVFKQQLDWGFQFQNPAFLAVMMTIIFAFALSLAGVYTIKPPARLTEASESMAQHEGLDGSFFKGVLATLLGTPCVGPFLGPALGVAFSREYAWEIILIFLAVGVGMAFPYLLLILNPRFMRMGRRARGELSRKIQESRAWLVDFERVMAFVLFATVFYLIYVLEGVAGGKAAVWMVAFLLGLAFALWLWGRLVTMGRLGIALGLIAVPLLVLASGWFTFNQSQTRPATYQGGECHDLQWQEFSMQKVTMATAEGKTVLVDFTADWCPNCKYNEATALNIASTCEIARQFDIVTLVADYTSRDPEIGFALRQLQRSAVPLTVVFPADDPSTPILLDGVYTATHLHDALREAAGS